MNSSFFILYSIHLSWISVECR